MSNESVAAGTAPDLGSRLLRGLSYRNIGVVYLILFEIALFGIWNTEFFLTWDTMKQIPNQNAIVALLGLALVVPLCARNFDLSIAGIASLSGVVTAELLRSGAGIVASIAAGIGAALVVGLFNGFIVVGLGIDSFIGTLATGSLIEAYIIFRTNDIPIVHESLSGSFSEVAVADIWGFALPVLYAIVVGAAIWFLLRHTATGRRFYATGFNPDAAKLAGIRVNRLRFVSFLVSAGIAGIAGIVLAAQTASGSSTAGDPFLLPAFAAAFVGATQLTAGRFNAWGTLLAVLMLGILIYGLGIVAAPTWTPKAFTGGILIAALALTAPAEARAVTAFIKGRFRRKAPPPAAAAPPSPPDA